MSLEKLTSKYIVSAEKVFSEVKVADKNMSVDVDSVRKVLNFAKDYLDDAKYYRDKDKFEVCLASVAYCEGLLDALRLLGLVKFEWIAEKKRKKEK